MNIRKPVDYGTMYRELTAILTQNLPQMDEVYAIGKGISQRPEKGAAVAAAEYLQANFPDRSGFDLCSDWSGDRTSGVHGITAAG